MPRLLAILFVTTALVLAACANNTTPAGTERAGTPAPLPVGLTLPAANTATEPMTLFDFETTDAAQWSIENDGVMGGRSKGFVEIADGALVFTGTVVTRGGGFTSTRAARRLDLAGYDGIELRVRGSGRTFELDVDDGTRSRGREVNRRGPVPTSDAWETVRVPFDALEESAHGQRVRVAALDRSGIRSIGVYIIDGRDGPFRLEVDWMRAYREAE